MIPLDNAGSPSFAARKGRFRPWWSSIAVTIHGWTGPAPRIAYGSRAVSARVGAAGTMTFTIPDAAGPATVSWRR